ncbi:SDR family oxidoreductase [Terrabacter sp. Root181]|uniref:SDR family oxidoreductase n=1 Tax=Terrabacter sp. Root181 TaxID=1736484 RepID=UPI0006FD6625|nr:SDR family oxidoreductase [Terrabacter sp. Root181]KRB47024.1 3-beta hydroxysteroid dehydrogenase [Terrabacter sp. Root181]
MRVFVTGASGWIGSAVVPELLAHSHSVVGLARSDASAAALEQAGAEVVRGGIDDLDVLRDAAAASDGVIHLAFKHDIAFSGDYAGAATADSAAIETLGSALEGTGKPFFIASGVLGLTAPGQVATETDGHDIDPSAVGPAARALNAELALSFAERGVRSGTVRLAPTVHGEGDEGFMASIVGVAKEKGVSAYVGDGSNRWPAVHRSDAARLYRLALEQAPPGSTLHAVAEGGVSFRDIAEAIGHRLDVPVTSIDPADAAAHFGWLGGFIGLDSLASSAATRELLGWQPTGPSLIEDLDAGHYTRSEQADWAPSR